MNQRIAQSDESKPDIDILIIGHVTKDMIGATPAEGYRMGGTVSFAAVTALRLGRQASVITRAASLQDVSGMPESVNVHLLPGNSTTTFANIYHPEGRLQYVYTPAAAISAADIPIAFRTPQAVLLGPLVDEIGVDVAELFGDQSLVVAVPQGWMRRWDKTGRVYSKPWEDATEILPHIDILILSLEDIDGDLRRLNPIYEHVDLVILTEYRDGSTIYQRQPDGSISEFKVQPRPAVEVDPTGAGDTFATAFMVRYQETRDPIEAARFANVTASFGVEGKGIDAIPTRRRVLAYMKEHPMLDSRG